ncbi:MAG: hypothetical protein ABW321_00720 [Polyangiales bacterium]
MIALIRSGTASVLTAALCAATWAPARAAAQAAPPPAPPLQAPAAPPAAPPVPPVQGPSPGGPPPTTTPPNPLPPAQPELVAPLSPPSAEEAPVQPPNEPPLPAATAETSAEPLPAATAEPLPAPDPVLAPVEEHPSKLPSYILWGAGGASLIVGAIFGASALAAKSDFDDDPTYSHADSVERRALVADVALGLGLVLAVTGTVFFFTSDTKPEGTASAGRSTQASAHTPRLQLTPLLSPRGGGAAASWRF